MNYREKFAVSLFLFFFLIFNYSVIAQNVDLPKAGSAEESAAAEEDAPGWLIDIMDKGGPVMYPIFLCSILGLAIIFERAIKLRSKRIFPQDFIIQIKTFLKKKDIPRVIALCESRKIPLARIIRMGLLKYKDGLEAMEGAIESAGSLEIAILGERMRMLSALANLAPLLGFLGTVTGMIKSFNIIAATGSGRPDLIAGGISESLITTAAGLFVGIPLTMGYFYFQGRVESIIIELEELCIGLLEELGR
ncbi:MAG: MotA/TolQ/ExbB proton channel family protein [bacterium]